MVVVWFYTIQLLYKSITIDPCYLISLAVASRSVITLRGRAIFVCAFWFANDNHEHCVLSELCADHSWPISGTLCTLIIAILFSLLHRNQYIASLVTIFLGIVYLQHTLFYTFGKSVCVWKRMKKLCNFQWSTADPSKFSLPRNVVPTGPK